MPNTPARLRELLQKIKENGGETQTYAQMAEQAGVPRSTLFRIMNGEREPNWTTTAKLCQTWPELAAVFLPPDSPDGNVEIHEPVKSETPA